MCTSGLIKYKGSYCTYKIMEEAGMPQRGTGGIPEFPGHLGRSQYDSRRGGVRIQEAHEYTPRRSCLDGLDITVDESMDHANA